MALTSPFSGRPGIRKETPSGVRPGAKLKEGSDPQGKASRFLPLDAYRGFILILLVSDGFGFGQLPNYGFYRFIAVQFDVMGMRRLVFPLVVVGMNSLFIYCLHDLLRGRIDSAIKVFSGSYTFLGVFAPVAQSCSVLLVIWLIAYWMYRRGIFVKV
jgi:predicted acyltransferase